MKEISYRDICFYSLAIVAIICAFCLFMIILDIAQIFFIKQFCLTAGLFIFAVSICYALFGDDTKLNVFNYNGEEGWEAVNSIAIPVISFTGTNDDGIMAVIEPKKAMEILERESCWL